MNPARSLRNKDENVAFMYGLLRSEILQNDQLALTFLAAAFVLGGSLTTLAFSDITALDTIHPNDVLTARSLLFGLAAAVGVLALLASVDRNLNTFRIASYIRIKLEPELEGAAWETDLKMFRRHHRFQGYGLFGTIQILFYAILIGFNVTFLLSPPGSELSTTKVITAIGVTTVFAIGGLLLLWLYVYRSNALEKNWRKVLGKDEHFSEATNGSSTNSG